MSERRLRTKPYRPMKNQDACWFAGVMHAEGSSFFEDKRPTVSISTAPRSCGIARKAAQLTGGTFIERAATRKRPPECRFRARGVRAVLTMNQAIACMPTDPKRVEFERWLEKAKESVKRVMQQPGPRAEMMKELGLSLEEIRKALQI